VIRARIGSSAGWITLSVLLGAAVQWAIVLVIARVQGPVGIGQYTLAQSYVIPISYLAWMSLRQHLLVEADDRNGMKPYLLLRAIVPLGLYAVVGASIVLLYQDRRIGTITAAVFVAKYVEGFGDLAAGIFQRKGRAGTMALFAAVRAIASIVAFIAAFIWLGQLELALVIMAVVALATTMLLDYPVVLRIWPVDSQHEDDETLLAKAYRLGATCLPLGGAAIVVSINASIPRLLVDHFNGAHELGYFAAVSHFVVMGGLIVAALAQSMLPALSKDFASDRSAFWRLLLVANLVVFAICVIAAGVAALIGGKMLGAVYGPTFAGSAGLLVVGALASIFIYGSYIIASAGMAGKIYKSFIPLYLGVCIANVAVGAALIPYLSSTGAFIAQSVAAITQIVGFVVVLRRQGAVQAVTPSV
jgi:O-antigen/teichoic acid export membrane protein